MSAPLPPAGEDREVRRRRRGAAPVAGAADPNRKRRLAALAILAALIVVAAVLVILKLAGSSDHTAGPARHPAAASGAPASGAAGGTASAGTGTAASPAFGLVGGGGVAAMPATGKLGIQGSAGDVLFAEDGTALDTSARQVVATAAQEIRRHNPATVTVTGYTDAIGNAAVNHQLSLARARAVVSALRTDLGATTVRFLAEAQGKSQPVATNSNPAGRQLNRRVVILLG
jgi:outer membrane protein OmpA-like peptidoglycan-associated protein